MSKFIEIPSISYDTIDEIIATFEMYREEHGGKCTFTIDTCEEEPGYPEVYMGFETKDNTLSLFKEN